MNTYEITFQRENGTTGTDRFTAATEAQARRDFKEVYRHGNGTITSVELVAENTPATKEQERKALAQIRKIVEGLGPDSYIATAFEGCFEIAEDNIENDFACSMKQRADKAAEEAQYFKGAAENYAAEAEKIREEVETLRGKVLTTAEAGAIKEIVGHRKLEAARLADSSAQSIVELADNPDSAEFRQAVQDNRNSKRRMAECDTLIQRILEIMR